MGVTIMWEPVKDRRRSFSGGSSRSFEALKRAFARGERIVIGEEAIPTLRGLLAAQIDDELFAEIIEKIEAVGVIEITGQW